MLKYSPVQAFVVGLKYLAASFVFSNIITTIVLMIQVPLMISRGEELSIQMLFSAVSSPWILVVNGFLSWMGVMVWEFYRRRDLFREVMHIRFDPLILIIPVALLSAGAVILNSELGNLLVTLLPLPKFLTQMFGNLMSTDVNPISAPMALVIMAPLVEETIFRGMILRGLLARVSPWKAIAISALVFAFIHLNPWQGVVTFLLGLLWGWMYLRTGSLGFCIVAHAINNGAALLSYNMTTSIDGFGEEMAMDVVQFQPWWLNLTGLGLLVIGVGLFHLLAPKRRVLLDTVNDDLRRTTPPDLPFAPIQTSIPPPLPQQGV